MQYYFLKEYAECPLICLSLTATCNDRPHIPLF